MKATEHHFDRLDRDEGGKSDDKYFIASNKAQKRNQYSLK